MTSIRAHFGGPENPLPVRVHHLAGSCQRVASTGQARAYKSRPSAPLGLPSPDRLPSISEPTSPLAYQMAASSSSDPNPKLPGEGSSSGAAELCLGLHLGPSALPPPPPQPQLPVPVGPVEVPVQLGPAAAARPPIPRDPKWKARREEARRRKEEKLMAGARPGWPYFVDRRDPRLDVLAAAATAAAGFGQYPSPHWAGSPSARMNPNAISAQMPGQNASPVMTCPPAGFGAYPQHVRSGAARWPSYVAPCWIPPPAAMAEAEGSAGFRLEVPNLVVAPADAPLHLQNETPIQVMPTPGGGKGKTVVMDSTARPPSSPSTACSPARPKLILEKPTATPPPPPAAGEPEKIWVACRADGRLTTGFLYKYTRAEVVIVCTCHGRAFSPAGFVSHAGCTNVSQPLKHIFVCPFTAL